MKRLLACLVLLTSTAGAEPYLQTPFAGPGLGKWYPASGAAFSGKLAYEHAQTNVVVLYHPLSAGSLIPAVLQTWVPPESWACTLGGNYGGNMAPSGGVAAGCGVNLADAVRSWLATWLLHANSAGAKNLGLAIAPRANTPTLFAQWQEEVQYGGKPHPSWFFGVGYGF